jgi:L-threonylcarbamoyladenylate synthase
MARLSDQGIQRAVEILKAGGLVAFPTETVYGLGADASNPAAVRRIFAAKGRPADHPLIVHLASATMLPQWAREIPPGAAVLAARYWPGPLTIILGRADGVIDEVTGGQNTVGVRVPSHPMAQALLHAFGGGIAAPSANRFGRISPTTAQHVRDELGDRIELILDGGPCDVGIESTIVDFSSGVPVLLRPGRIAPEEIEALLGMPVRRGGPGAPRASGTLAAHYAPRLPLLLVSAEDFDEVVSEQGRLRSVAVLAHHPKPAPAPVTHWQLAPTDPLAYAHDLYAALRTLDESGCDLILVEAPPETAAWAAVRDRLQRAAAGSTAPSEDAT